jgi:NAD(P)-dependent dehydrogenase (short-subunit alcohol dehydrogenase family)
LDLGIAGKTAIVTGGGGAICGAIAMALAREGAAVALWDLSEEAARRRAREVEGRGGRAVAVRCDACSPKEVEEALRQTVAALGGVDILVNGAGGSRADATTSADLEFFAIGKDALQSAVGLNFLSAVIPSQAVGRAFRDKGEGVILNIASIAGMRPLSRAVAYSTGKAALINFTQWLAVHMATEYSPRIRVNAIAPGFVLTDQNRFLMTDRDTGEPTERGRQVLRHVPMARLGEPEDMAGAVLWLVSDQARFVTGAVVPVDGGFTANSGV